MHSGILDYRLVPCCPFGFRVPLFETEFQKKDSLAIIKGEWGALVL